MISGDYRRPNESVDTWRVRIGTPANDLLPRDAVCLHQ